jgi:hypothetical protein
MIRYDLGHDENAVRLEYVSDGPLAPATYLATITVPMPDLQQLLHYPPPMGYSTYGPLHDFLIGGPPAVIGSPITLIGFRRVFKRRLTNWTHENRN